MRGAAGGPKDSGQVQGGTRHRPRVGTCLLYWTPYCPLMAHHMTSQGPPGAQLTSPSHPWNCFSPARQALHPLPDSRDLVLTVRVLFSEPPTSVGVPGGEGDAITASRWAMGAASRTRSPLTVPRQRVPP